MGEGGAAASSSSLPADEEDDEADDELEAGPGDDERTGGGIEGVGEVSRDESEERSLDGASSSPPPSSSWSLGGEPRGIVVGSGAVTIAAALMVVRGRCKEEVRSQEARAKEAVIFELVISQAHWMVARETHGRHFIGTKADSGAGGKAPAATATNASPQLPTFRLSQTAN